MGRIVFATALFLLSACAENPFDPHALRRFPHGTAVSKGLNLSRDDEDQICKLVRGATAGHITYIHSGLKPNSIVVLCDLSDGLYSDVIHLQKVGSIWHVTGKGLVMR